MYNTSKWRIVKKKEPAAEPISVLLEFHHLEFKQQFESRLLIQSLSFGGSTESRETTGVRT